MSGAKRVSAYIALIVFMLSVIFVIYTIVSRVGTFGVMEKNQVRLVRNIYYDFPNRIYSIIDREYALLASDKELIKAFADRDRGKLERLGQKYYVNLLHTSEGVKALLHFELPDMTCFYRFDIPDKYGDSLKGVRPMLADAVRLKKPVRGFEVGRYGLAQRVIYPLFYNDRFVGAVEYGLGLGFFMKRIQKITEIKTGLLVFHKNMTAYVNRDELPSIGNYYEIYDNDRELFDSIGRKDMENQYFTVKGRHYLVTNGFYIINYSGEKIGKMVFVADRTDLIHWIYRYITYVVLLFAFSLMVIYVIVKRKILPLVGSIEKSYLDANRELMETNRKLEERVAEEVDKNRKHEELLHSQNKITDMGRMINAIAHHWRQPLNALGLYVQDILDSVRNGECTQEYIADSERDSMRLIMQLSDTIDDFRSFFRADGEQSSEFIVIYEVVTLLKMMKSQLDNNNIKLMLTCRCGDNSYSCSDVVEEPDRECRNSRVVGYKGEFKQVLLNILSNSIDAVIDNRAKGRIDKGKLDVEVICSDENIRMIISDNGGGVPDKDAVRIFDPYFSTKEEGKGVGLGLYMSKIIVEQHLNGTISFNNDAVGAVFTVDLPISR